MTTQRLTMKTWIALATIFSSFLITPNLWAAVYHVDATGGNDSNNGTSAPWKTIAKVNSSRFLPGDSILFKKGETWREVLSFPSSGSMGNVITFGAYGSGMNPIISGSDLITAGWAKDSNSIWKATVTTKPNVVYFNGTLGKKVTTKAGITSEFQWFWASNVLYVWSPTNSNPSVYYNKPGIEAGSKSFGVIRTNDKSYVTVDGITVRDGNTSNVNAGSASVIGIVFQNCIVERASESGFDLKGSVTPASVTIDHCMIRSNGTWGIWVQQTYTAATFSNNTITGNVLASVRDSMYYAGIEGQLGNANIFGNKIYANVSSFGTDQIHGIYVDASAIPCNIYNNTIYNHTNGEGIKARGSANIYRNILYGNSGAGIEVGGNGSTNINVAIYQNVLYGNNTSNRSDAIVEQQKGAGTLYLTVNNNTIYQNGNSSQEEIKIANDITALTMKNNIFYATATRRTLWASKQTGIVSIDNNIHWRADGNPNIYYNGAERTWTQWKALGFDTYGVRANPAFTDASAAVFTLQSGSPAIDAGANLGLSVDLSGQMVPNGGVPDIGAYEWGGSPSYSATPLNVQFAPD